MKMMIGRFFLLFLLLCPVRLIAQEQAMISGKILSTEKEIVDFATVYLKGTTYGGTTNEEGIYHLKAPAGTYTLVVSAIGYETVEKQVTLTKGERIKQNITIRPKTEELEEVVIVSNGISRLKRSAFNAVALDTKGLENSNRSLSEALAKAPGMKVRESGGVGSDMQLSLDGFSGKHIKVFIDGVPQEGVGSSFGLNNIPAGFAERIEVYKGVVPVGFGTDAIGGVINIITKKKRDRWFLDASYSYGSFNTHKSYVHFGQTLKNGFTYEINAFQNYSDNDYKVDVNPEVFTFNPDGSVSTYIDTRNKGMGRPPDAGFHLLAHVSGRADRCAPSDRLWRKASLRPLADALIGISQTKPAHKRARRHPDRQLQPQRDNQCRHLSLPLQLVRRTLPHELARRTVAPIQPRRQRQLERDTDVELPLRTYAHLHVQSRFQRLPPAEHVTSCSRRGDRCHRQGRRHARTSPAYRIA